MSRVDAIRWFHGITGFACPHCGSRDQFCAERHGLLQKFVLPLLLVQPVRCYGCNCLYYGVSAQAIAPVALRRNQAAVAAGTAS